MGNEPINSTVATDNVKPLYTVVSDKKPEGFWGKLKATILFLARIASFWK